MKGGRPMRAAIPNDLAEAFESAVLQFLPVDYAATEPIVEFRGRNEPLSVICFIAAQFDDPLPKRVADKLRAYLYAEPNAFRAGLGAKPSYARAAQYLRIVINRLKAARVTF
jgi:hypothetical protein